MSSAARVAMAIRAVWASVGARSLSGGAAVVFALLLTGCPEAVTGPEKATQLFFTLQPTATVAGLPITPAVQVTARDARGNPAAGFTGTVTVALGTNPAGGTLSGSTTVAAVAGIATFPALSVDKSGSGYALTATASGLSGATSATFVITPGTPTQLALCRHRRRGEAARLRGAAQHDHGGRQPSACRAGHGAGCVGQRRTRLHRPGVGRDHGRDGPRRGHPVRDQDGRPGRGGRYVLQPQHRQEREREDRDRIHAVGDGRGPHGSHERALRPHET